MKIAFSNTKCINQFMSHKFYKNKGTFWNYVSWLNFLMNEKISNFLRTPMELPLSNQIPDDGRSCLSWQQQRVASDAQSLQDTTSASPTILQKWDLVTFSIRSKITNPIIPQIIKAFCKESWSSHFFPIGPPGAENLFSCVVSIFVLGGVSGSLTASFIADRYGRLGAMTIGHVFGIVAGILFAIVESINSVEVLLLARFLVGECEFVLLLMEDTIYKIKFLRYDIETKFYNSSNL